MSDFDFDSALAAQVERQQQAGSAPPAEATEDDIIERYGEANDPNAPEVEVEDLTPDPGDGETIVEDEVTPEEQAAAQERDSQGRFLPKFDDPEIQSYIEKFGGLEQALKVGANAQSLIGRQADEVHAARELKREVEELRQLVEQRNQPAPAAPGQFEEAIAEDPAAVAHWALLNNQTDVYDAAVEAWYDVAPRDAARFERALEIEMLRQEISESTAPVVQQQQAATQEQAVVQLRAKYDDFADVVSTATPDELAGLDRDVIETLEQKNPAAALEMVYKWVKASRPVSAVATSQDGAAATAAAEAARAQKLEAAAVARGSSRPAPGEKSTMDLLKESMLAPDPFNVQHGLHSRETV